LFRPVVCLRDLYRKQFLPQLLPGVKVAHLGKAGQRFSQKSRWGCPT
jgi:hypothetical protein